MLPVAFQYTFTSPRSGFNEARFDRLMMAQSEAVQYLFVGGYTGPKPHLHGLEAYPEDVSRALGHHFTRKHEGAKRMKDLKPLQRRKKIPKAGTTSLATTELFQWAARTTGTRRPIHTDP